MKLSYMRIVISSVLFVGLLMLQDCSQNCTCYRDKCTFFANDSIRICQSSYANVLQYSSARDSLYNLYYRYGPLHDTTYGQVNVGGGSTPVNSVLGQLEAQGYNCECFPTPK